MKIEYLKKPLANGPYMWTIATTAEEFYHIQETYAVERHHHDKWELGDDTRFSAMTHFFDGLVIVCLPQTVTFSTLVHEAVHVFERFAQEMGEEHPSEEFRAYSTQFIFDQMADALAKRQIPKATVSTTVKKSVRTR
jgi:hypothetical protein